MSPSGLPNIAWIGWLKEPRVLMWLGIGSATFAVASLLALHFYLANIPVDYFVAERRRCLKGPFCLIVRILKNIVGLIVLLLGIAMLVLPGQGILTILVGLSLLDFPGKYRMERRIVSLPGVLRTINLLRARSNRPPLRVGGRSTGAE